MEKFNESVSLRSHLKALGLQVKLGKQSVHEDLKEVFEPVTKPIKDVSEDVTKTQKVTSEENIEAITVLNDQVLELLNDRRIIASYLVSLLSKLASPEHTSQFKLVKRS